MSKHTLHIKTINLLEEERLVRAEVEVHPARPDPAFPDATPHDICIEPQLALDEHGQIIGESDLPKGFWHDVEHYLIRAYEKYGYVPKEVI